MTASDHRDPAARDEHAASDVDVEITLDTDPVWLDDLLDRDGGDDAEQTTDADADLVEQVRAAARAARSRLAAPPDTPTEESPTNPDVEVAATEPAPDEAAAEPAAAPPKGIDSTLPPPPAGVSATEVAWAMPRTTSGLAPPTPVVAAVPVEAAPPVEQPPPAEPALSTTVAPAAPGRWQPPARLRPAETRAATPLLPSPTARRHLDRRWAIAGVVVAAVVGFLIALAVSGGDDSPDPTTPGATTVPGASTPTTTP